MPLPFTLRQTLVPIVKAGPQRWSFPVRRIYCIGQNYESHAREMGGHTSKNNPFFFSKPADALVTLDHPARNASADSTPVTTANTNLTMRYPSVTESYHHEVELVVAVGPRHSCKDGELPDHLSTSHDDASAAQHLSYFNLSVEEANDVIYGYGVGLDMTRRDMQAQAKEHGKPWDLAKGGDDCAAVSPLVLAQDLKEQHPNLFTNHEMDDSLSVANGHQSSPSWPNLNVTNGHIFLTVNGNERQKGNMDCMVNTPAEIISILSKLVTLNAGDLIFTGTPSGVGPVRRGDVMVAGVEGIGEITVTMV